MFRVRFALFSGVVSSVDGLPQEALNAHVEFLKGVVLGQAGWADRQGKQVILPRIDRSLIHTQ